MCFPFLDCRGGEKKATMVVFSPSFEASEMDQKVFRSVLCSETVIRIHFRGQMDDVSCSPGWASNGLGFAEEGIFHWITLSVFLCCPHAPSDMGCESFALVCALANQFLVTRGA